MVCNISFFVLIGLKPSFLRILMMNFSSILMPKFLLTVSKDKDILLLVFFGSLVIEDAIIFIDFVFNSFERRKTSRFKAISGNDGSTPRSNL